MNKLILKILILLAIISTSLVLFVYLTPIDEDAYIGAVKDKNKLLENAEKPKMVFIGGSNLAFGLNSEKLESKLDFDVINMGIHAGMGLKFIMNEVKPYIAEGDIVVVAPEYSHFYGTLNGDATLGQTLEYTPESIKNLDENQLISLFTNIPEFTRRDMQLTARLLLDSLDHGNVYFRSAFDENGDVITHLELDSIDISEFPLFSSEARLESVDQETIEFLNDYIEYCNNRSAQVYFSYPSIPKNRYEEHVDLIKGLEDKLNTELKCDVISTPENYVYGNEMFFDTVYHLNSKGREIRTLQVLNDLERVIQ